MITLIYIIGDNTPAWSDDELMQEGWNTHNTIHEQQFETEQQLEDFLERNEVSAGESEGYITFKPLLAFDRETSWHRRFQ